MKFNLKNVALGVSAFIVASSQIAPALAGDFTFVRNSRSFTNSATDTKVDIDTSSTRLEAYTFSSETDKLVYEGAPITLENYEILKAAAEAKLTGLSVDDPALDPNLDLSGDPADGNAGIAVVADDPGVAPENNLLNEGYSVIVGTATAEGSGEMKAVTDTSVLIKSDEHTTTARHDLTSGDGVTEVYAYNEAGMVDNHTVIDVRSVTDSFSVDRTTGEDRVAKIRVEGDLASAIDADLDKGTGAGVIQTFSISTTGTIAKSETLETADSLTEVESWTMSDTLELFHETGSGIN